MNMPPAIQQTADGEYPSQDIPIVRRPCSGTARIMKLNADGAGHGRRPTAAQAMTMPTSIQQTADGGYIVAGYTNSFGAGVADAWVLKLNADGSRAWQKTYGGSGDDVCPFRSSKPPIGDISWQDIPFLRSRVADAWVLKLNADGSTAWQKAYGGSDSDFGYSIQQTADGGYIVTGQTWSFGAGSWDAQAQVLKLNADGSTEWQKAYGGSGSDSASSIQQTAEWGICDNRVMPIPSGQGSLTPGY